MQTDEAPAGYIRGGGGIIDTRRTVRALVGSCLLALAVFVVVLTIEAFHKNSRLDHLQQRGVAVDVTVTGCLGLASGTGITVTSYQCTGTFTLQGRNYSAVIVGSSVNHPIGETVQAVADPKHPTTLSTASSLVGARSTWHAFIAPAIVFMFLLVLAALVMWWPRRNALQRLPKGEALGG